MSNPESHPDHADPGAVASRFVQARLAAQALPGFPGGQLPADLAAGYACQDAAIALWPDRIVGWKVGYIAPQRRDGSGDTRVVGPIFSRALWHWQPGEVLAFPVFVGGFAAVEAEYIFRLGADAPAEQTEFGSAEAMQLVDALYVGVETAGSPLATINELGPTVVVADFGNNAGLILGPEVPDWRNVADADLTCSTSIGGVRMGRGGAGSVPGGLAAALAFALGRCARRGLPLRAGSLVTTGAATGIHDIAAGQRACIEFDGFVAIECRAVAASPRPGASA